MPTAFRPHAPDRMLPLASDVRDRLPEGHFAHHVSDLVDGVDLAAFDALHIGRLAGRLEPSRVPCAPLRPAVSRRSRPSPSRIRSGHPPACLELSSCGADS